MNKIIKRLLEEASGKIKHTMVDNEVLTELMIEECVNSLRSNGYDDAAQLIEQHFKEESK
jgi:spore germination protein YaaH